MEDEQAGVGKAGAMETGYYGCRQYGAGAGYTAPSRVVSCASAAVQWSDLECN